MKNKKLKALLWLLPVAAIVAAVRLLPQKAVDTSGAEVMTEHRSATVSRGSIDSVFVGGGFLSETGSVTLSYPGNVRLLQWEVSENEVVARGQTLATYDKNSVLAAVSELSELMNKLDAALEQSRNEKLPSTVLSPLAGRIVAVFAQAGDSVQQCIDEHGALMLLSLDGRLQVAVPAGELAAGDGLRVRCPDGTTLGGVVSEVMEGSAYVTVSDALTTYGETVSVYDDSNTLLGSGELGVHRPMAITGIGGTVKSVTVKQGASVYANQTLLTLTDTDYSVTYDSLLLKRQKLEQQIDALYALYNAGSFKAPATGYVSALNADLVGLSDSKDRKKTGGFAGRTLPTAFSDGGSSRVTLLSDEPEPKEPEDPEEPEEPETYLVASFIDAYDPQSGDITFRLTSGLQWHWNMAELLAACPNVNTAFFLPHNMVVLEYTAEDNVLVDCTVYMALKGGGGGGGGGGGSAKTAEKEETYVAEETSFCTFTAFDKVDIVLTVDELDVSRLFVGQAVEVTLDALPDRLYTAAITQIDPNGANDGGNTKYSVTVTVDRDGEMLSGMNASVRIPLGTKSDLLLLSAEALQEDEGGTFVYTSYNEKNGYGGRKAVTTGLSDGGMVEIVSGLTEGETVYYPFAEKMEYTFAE